MSQVNNSNGINISSMEDTQSVGEQYNFEIPQQSSNKPDMSPQTHDGNITNIKLTDVLSFCYGLSETDIKVLLLLAKGDIKRVEDLIKELNTSKAGVNRSLNRLLETGLVMRVKEPGIKVGRPRYQYWVVKDVKEKILKDIRDCAERMAKLVEEELINLYPSNKS